MSKQLKSALRRLRNGVPIYRKDETSPHKRGTFKVEFSDSKYYGAVIVHTDMGDSFVDMVVSTASINQMRRIISGYYPAVAKAFGPARQFAGI